MLTVYMVTSLPKALGTSGASAKGIVELTRLRVAPIRASVFLIAIVVFVLAIGWQQLSRAGYSPDEEFTVFAVKGIRATGLPLLPSGLLYDRGLAYSSAAWAIGSIAGVELPAYRSAAWLSAAAALLLIFRIVSRVGSTTSATIAVALVAVSLPWWAASTTARFYAPFLASYLAALLYLIERPRGVWPVAGLVLAGLCRLTHELAFTLAVIPSLAFLLAPRGTRRRWVVPTAVIVAGLVASQALIFGLHYLTPSSGNTMIRRFFVWQVLNLFEAPPNRQFSIVAVVLLFAWLIDPRHARRNLAIALGGVALIVSLSIARALAIAPFSWALVQNVLTEGSRYPLDMFWHIAQTTPATIAVALGLLLARLAGGGGEWRPLERAAHVLWIGWVVWFGVIDSGITINYLLLPISLMLMAIAVDLAAIVAHNIDLNRSAGRTVGWAIAALLVAGIAADQWRGEGPLTARLDAARPTIHVAGIEEIRDSLRPGDRVACTDELACLMLIGRIDAWLALDDFVRERFVVRKGDGQLVGVYTGKPAVFRPADLFDTGQPAGRTLMIDVFKEYPIGNSRDWLPRALERDGLEVRPLLESPQARIVEIGTPPARRAAAMSGR